MFAFLYFLLQCFIFWFVLKILITNFKTTIYEVFVIVSVSVCASYIFGFVHYQWTVGVSFGLLFLAFAYMLYKTKGYTPKKSIALAATSLVICTLVDHFTVFLLQHIPLGITLDPIARIFLFNFLLFALSSIIGTYFVVRYSRKLRLIINQSEALQTFLMMVSVFTLITLYTNLLFAIFRTGDYTAEALRLNLAFFVIYTLIAVAVIYIYAQSLKQKYEADRKRLEQEALQNYMDEIERQYTAMRMFKHDYINILSSFESYFEEKDYDRLAEYYYSKVKRTSDSLLTHDFKLEKLNKLKILELKSIFANKLMLAQSLNIEFTFELTDEIMYVGVETVVLVRMIGILLDNAIESVAELGHGKIEIALFKNGRTVTLIVQNDCVADIPKLHQLKQAGFSTKGDGRGLGLDILSNFVRGAPNLTLETTIEHGKFMQRIIIQEG